MVSTCDESARYYMGISLAITLYQMQAIELLPAVITELVDDVVVMSPNYGAAAARRYLCQELQTFCDSYQGPWN